MVELERDLIKTVAEYLLLNPDALSRFRSLLEELETEESEKVSRVLH